MKPKILPAQRDRPAAGCARTLDFPVASAVGAINPIINAPKQSVHAQLLVALTKASQQNPPFVGTSIAIIVFQEQDIGRSRDQHTAVPGQNSIWKGQLLSKDCHVLITPVTISILQ